MRRLRCIFFRPKLKSSAGARNEADYFRQADAKYAPCHSGKTAPHHLYVNEPAARIIRVAIRSRFGEHPGIAGLILGPNEAAAIEQKLRVMVASEDRRDVQARIKIVAQEFSLARAKDSIVTVVNADPSISAKDIRAAEREEEAHRAILLSAGGPFSERFIGRFLSQRETLSVLPRFRQLRPYVVTPLEIANELPVLLINGERQSVGLGSAEAERLWYLFAKLLIEEHGEQALAILKYGHSEHREKVAKRIRREMGEGIRTPPRPAKKPKGQRRDS